MNRTKRSSRGRILGALLAMGALSLGVSAYQQPPAAGGGGRGRGPEGPKLIEVQKLKDNLFMLKGGGGNTAVFVTANGVVIVDTKNPGWGQTLIDKVKELTDKPITTLINSHTHFDHVGGNVEFPTTVEIIAHAEHEDEHGERPAAQGIRAAGRPGRVQGEQRQEHREEDVQGQDDDWQGQRPDRSLLLRARAHERRRLDRVSGAPGDARRRHLFRQDVADPRREQRRQRVEMPDTLAKAARVKDVDAIITGHSTVMTPADLKEYSDFNRDFLNFVREAKKAGKSVDEVAASWKNPVKYAGYQQPQAERVKANAQMIYDETK